MAIARRLCLFAAFALLAGQAHAAGGGSGATERRITSAASYIPINGLSASVMEEFSPVGMLLVDFGLDIPDPALRQRAARMLPRLRDAGRTAVAEYAFSRQRPGVAPDPVQLTALLQRNVDQTLGATGAKVLIANVMLQRGR